MDRLHRGGANFLISGGLLASQGPSFMQLVVSNDFNNLQH